MKYCQKCKAEIGNDSIFCPFCGEKQKEERKFTEFNNNSTAMKEEIYNLLKEPIARLVKTNKISAFSYLDVSSGMLDKFKEFKKSDYVSDLFRKDFSEEDFIFCLSKKGTFGKDYLLFMSNGIKKMYGSEYSIEDCTDECDYKEIGSVDSYKGDIFLENIDNPRNNLIVLKFDLKNTKSQQEWVKNFEELIALGKKYPIESEGYEDELNEVEFNSSKSNDYEEFIKPYEDNNYEAVNYSNPNEIREKMLSTINEYKDQLYDSQYYSFFSFKDLPEKNKENILKMAKISFDDEFIGMIDTSMAYSGKEGLIFTRSGVFEHCGPLSGSNFFSYKDIKNMSVVGLKDLCIEFNKSIQKNKNYMNISVCYFSEPLKELLTKLIQINKTFNLPSVLDGKSGKMKGYFNKKNRAAYYEGQLDGYKRCSREYEIKLRRQAELFLKVANKWKQERAEYEALLDEYDATIVELEARLAEAESPEYRERLNNVSDYREKLASLSY